MVGFVVGAVVGKIVVHRSCRIVGFHNVYGHLEPVALGESARCGRHAVAVYVGVYVVGCVGHVESAHVGSVGGVGHVGCVVGAGVAVDHGVVRRVVSAAHSRLELVGIRLKHGACLVAQSEASPPCRGVALGVESKRAADKLRAGARVCVAWVVLAKTVVEAFRSEEVVVHCGGKLVAGHVDNCRIGGGVAPCVGGCHIEHA